MPAIILRTGFEQIEHSIKFTAGVLKKGEKLAFCHIKHIEEYVDINFNNRIKAKCIRQTSVTEKPYELAIEINVERQIVRAECSCIAKETSECKHIAALIHRINNDRSVSKTSIEQEWGFPSIKHLVKEKYSKGTTVDELFPQKVLEKAPAPFAFTVEDFNDIECPVKKRMQLEIISGEERVCLAVMDAGRSEREEEIQVQCTKECIMHLLNAANHGIMIGSKEILLPETISEYYQNVIRLVDNDILELCLRTTQQSQSPEWFEARRLRITASKKAHQIKTRTRISAESLVQQFINPQTLNTESTRYGSQNEQKARENYKLERDVHVFQIGLFLSPLQPWLGVSVDGVVVSDCQVIKLLEIKCPISCRSKPIWDCTSEKFNVGFFEVSDDGSVQLKKRHCFYTQCQLQMYTTGMEVCDLYVWSPHGSYVVEVSIDYEFLSNLIPRLESFYFNKYLPALCNENQENATNPKE